MIGMARWMNEYMNPVHCWPQLYFYMWPLFNKPPYAVCSVTHYTLYTNEYKKAWACKKWSIQMPQWPFLGQAALTSAQAPRKRASFVKPEALGFRKPGLQSFLSVVYLKLTVYVEQPKSFEFSGFEAYKERMCNLNRWRSNAFTASLGMEDTLSSLSKPDPGSHSSASDDSSKPKTIASINVLPDEVLAHAFRFLSQKDR